MSGGGPKVRSMNVAESEVRPVLGPAGNKTRSVVVTRKPVSKPLRAKTVKKTHEAAEEKKDLSSPSSSPVAASSPPPLQSFSVPFLHSNLSLSASCSSDASSDSLQSRGSTGRITRPSMAARRRMQCVSKMERIVTESVPDSGSTLDISQAKRRCAWVTSNTEPCYAAFHDEEWGVPVHDDKKLFELLVLSGALAELSWPTILGKRHIFREVFANFDPIAVSKLNEKKITATGSTASSLLSEPKLRAVMENARQMSKVVEEFGSFNKYIWSFVNHKPIVNKFRYPRQVPAKSAKADFITKDLLRRGFRSVSPTIIYSFMQVAGLTNDHLTTCFRFQECISSPPPACGEEKNSKMKAEERKSVAGLMDLGLARAMDDLSFSSE